MYLIYCEKINIKQLDIKQFGLTFKPLSSEQKTYIKNEYKKISLRKEELDAIININNDGIVNIDRKKWKEIEENDEINYLIETCRRNRIKPKLNHNLDNFLKKIIVIEIDEKRLSKYINNGDFRLFLNHFIRLHEIFDRKSKKKERKSIFLPHEIKTGGKERNQPNFEELSLEIIYKFMFDSYNQDTYGSTSVGESFLIYIEDIKRFIEMISSDEIFKFIEIMEMLFNSNSLPQNNILNYTLIIESLLIKKESPSIKKEFVLKTGMIYKDMKLSKFNNSELSYLLGFLYDMRSTIIHGSMDKIYECYNNFIVKSKFKEEIILKEMSKMSKKYEIIYFTEYWAHLFAVMVIRYWISNNDKISYLKNN